MIKIVVDTKEELDQVRSVLKGEACSRNYCPKDEKNGCNVCITDYFKDRVRLYRKETVEVPTDLVV